MIFENFVLMCRCFENSVRNNWQHVTIEAEQVTTVPFNVHTYKSNV